MGVHSMWDKSHGQVGVCGKLRQFPLPPFLWDYSPMENGPDIQAIRDRIQREMEAKGFSKRSLSIASGMSPTGIRDLLERVDNPGIGTLHKIAEALQMPFDDINGSGRVQVCGKIGAGGQLIYFPEDHEFETVARPPLAPGPLAAFCVEGESMLPRFDPGDIVFVRRDHDGVMPAYLGKYCAVHLEDGGTYLKILAAGSKPGRYTLRSLNAADMPDCEVIWASPVLFVMQADAASYYRG